jgi:hypothetical protein
MTMSEQPNAPYLDAVVAYAFLGEAELVAVDHAVFAATGGAHLR